MNAAAADITGNPAFLLGRLAVVPDLSGALWLPDERTLVELSAGARESAGGSECHRFFFRMGCSGLSAGAAGGGSSSRTLGLSLAR